MPTAKTKKTFFSQATQLATGASSTEAGQKDQRTDELLERALEERIAPAEQVWSQDIPVERIRPNPFQPRTDFDTEESQAEIEGFAQAIRENGFISVLFVRPDPTEEGYFQLAYGERRWRAARLVQGLGAIPCRMARYSDDQMEDMGLLENVQRKALNPLDEAWAYDRKLKRTDPKTDRPYSIRGLADHLGVDKNRIAELHTLCRVPVDVQAMVRKRPDTVRAAAEIAKLPSSELRSPIISQVLQHDLSTKEVIGIVDTTLARWSATQQRPSIHHNSASALAASDVPTPEGRRDGAEKQPGGVFGEDTLTDGEVNTSSPTVTGNGQNPAASRDHDKVSMTLMMQQKKHQKRIHQDARVVLDVIHRWSEWAGEPESDKEALLPHVAGWLAAIQALHTRLES